MNFRGLIKKGPWISPTFGGSSFAWRRWLRRLDSEDGEKLLEYEEKEKRERDLLSR